MGVVRIKKNVMKQFLAGILLCGFLFSACSKNKNDSVNDVWVRLENQTSILLEDARVGNAGYGNVETGRRTEYYLVSTPIYAGYCNFRINNQESGAGYGVCGSPLPPAFEPGYYTFKVEPTSQGYFTVAVTKR